MYHGSNSNDRLKQERSHTDKENKLTLKRASCVSSNSMRTYSLLTGQMCLLWKQNKKIQDDSPCSMFWAYKTQNLNLHIIQCPQIMRFTAFLHKNVFVIAV